MARLCADLRLLACAGSADDKDAANITASANSANFTKNDWVLAGLWVMGLFFNRLLTSLKFIECAHSKKNKQYGASKTCLIIAESCERRNGTPAWSRAGVSVRGYRAVRSGTPPVSVIRRIVTVRCREASMGFLWRGSTETRSLFCAGGPVARKSETLAASGRLWPWLRGRLAGRTWWLPWQFRLARPLKIRRR